tara:strand:+ start:25108 stop:26040 length:933 start_codon:yes stop_codon:yes gene_type:complete
MDIIHYSRLFLCVIFFFTQSVSHAQKYFSLGVDNDLYFLGDKYYSSGIFLQYGKQLIPKEKAEQEFPKSYLLWELGQEIYTPSNRLTTDTSGYDYPYGGWLYIKVSFQKGITSNKQWQWGVELGATGDASLAQWMQNTYHRLFLNLKELPWIDEVPQAFHLNIFADSFRRWQVGEYVALQSHLFSKLGTQRIFAGLALGLNFGKQIVLPIGGNVLLEKKKGSGVYFGGRIQYIAHDYMLSGSLFNDNGPFTLPLNRVRALVEFGYSFHKGPWRISTVFFNRSPDNKIQSQKSHRYLKISITRFLEKQGKK